MDKHLLENTKVRGQEQKGAARWGGDEAGPWGESQATPSQAARRRAIGRFVRIVIVLGVLLALLRPNSLLGLVGVIAFTWIAWRIYESRRSLAPDELAKRIAVAKASGIGLKQVIKSPESYVGDLVAWPGTVILINERRGRTWAQVAYYYECEPTGDNFIVNLDGSFDVYEGDAVVVYGRFEHMKPYRSRAGWWFSSPVLKGFAMEKLSPTFP